MSGSPGTNPSLRSKPRKPKIREWGRVVAVAEPRPHVDLVGPAPVPAKLEVGDDRVLLDAVPVEIERAELLEAVGQEALELVGRVVVGPVAGLADDVARRRPPIVPRRRPRDVELLVPAGRRERDRPVPTHVAVRPEVDRACLTLVEELSVRCVVDEAVGGVEGPAQPHSPVPRRHRRREVLVEGLLGPAQARRPEGRVVGPPPGDDVDHAVVAVRSVQRTARPADDLDPLDVLHLDRDPGPANATEVGRVERHPVDQQQVPPGNGPGVPPDRQLVLGPVPGVHVDSRDPPEDVDQPDGSHPADLLRRDHRDRGRGLLDRLGPARRREDDVDVEELLQVELRQVRLALDVDDLVTGPYPGGQHQAGHEDRRDRPECSPRALPDP